MLTRSKPREYTGLRWHVRQGERRNPVEQVEEGWGTRIQTVNKLIYVCAVRGPSILNTKVK